MKKLIAILMCMILAAGIAAAAAEETGLTLTAPSGAPAIAVAALAETDPDHYRFIAADTIAAEFSKNESDFIIAPINAGAKLFKAGKSTYRLAAVITWGNLVYASQREDFRMEDISGRKITLFGENTINASVALYVLREMNIEPAEVEYLAGAAETQALLMNDPEAIVVTAEPAVTAAKMKNDRITSFAVIEMLEGITGTAGYAQAGLFVRAETLEADPEAVKAAIAQIRQSADETASNLEGTAKAAAALEILPNENVAMKAIPNCGIRFVPAAEAREAIEQTVMIDPVQFGGEAPADEFYYEAE